VNIKRTAVIGAGIMGSGISQALALAGFDVIAHDINPEALERFRDRIENGRFGIRRGVELAKVSEVDAAAALDRVTTTRDLPEACADADLVVEAVFEDFGLKVRTFRALDEISPARAILASNTSGFSIGALAGATARPGKVVGWHWASPASIMRLAEIITHPEVEPETVETVVEVARRAGKNPQVVKDHPLHWGFVANRVLMAAMREAQQIVTDGIASEEQVDTLLKDCFRWPSGLFEMLRNTSRNWDEADRRASPLDGGGHRVTIIPMHDEHGEPGGW
jgi:3-hydroxybutyryl-CoA dehydrogenase